MTLILTRPTNPTPEVLPVTRPLPLTRPLPTIPRVSLARTTAAVARLYAR